MQFVTISIYICPIRPSLPYIHRSIFLFPLLLPHIFQAVIFNSLPLSIIRLHSTPSHEQKRCTKSKFFIFFAFKHATRNTSKHPLRGLSMYLFPWVVFISHRQKKGIGCALGRGRRKKRALRYNRRYQNLKITQILFFFLAIAANNK